MINVTCALIVAKNQLLITQNPESSDHPFRWEFPGGKVKKGETAEECMHREIQEELNIEIEILEKLVAIEHDYGIKKIRLIPFVCRITKGIIQLNDHIAEKWIALNEVYDVDFSEADRILFELEENWSFLEKYIGE